MMESIERFAAASGCGAPIIAYRCTACHRPAAHDAFCCQGGASAGLAAAGFCVSGSDIADQPRYPFHFTRTDSVELLAEFGHLFALNTGSPPCQRYSACQRIRGREHPDLIAATRDAMQIAKRPYVIENVEDAQPELVDPILLCGSMFPGLQTYRHRLFETSFPVDVPAHLSTRAHLPTVKMGRPLRHGDRYHAVGNFSGVAYVRANMSVPWMNRDGIRECIPPAYTQFLGTQALARLTSAVA